MVRLVIWDAIAMISQITSLTSVCSTVYSDADQRKHQSSASLAFVRGIHRWPVNYPHKRPVTRNMFPFDDVIMDYGYQVSNSPAGHYRITLLVLCHVVFAIRLEICWSVDEISRCPNTSQWLDFKIGHQGNTLSDGYRGDMPYGPLTRYEKMQIAHALGMPGTFSPSPTSKETSS